MLISDLNHIVNNALMLTALIKSFSATFQVNRKFILAEFILGEVL